MSHIAWKAVKELNEVRGGTPVYGSCNIEDDVTVTDAGEIGPMVRYQLGEWSEAPQWMANRGYHLLVFEELWQALRLGGTHPWKVLKCECEEEVEVPPKLDWCKSHLWWTYIDRERNLEDLIDYRDRCWLVGTRMFKRVKPLEVAERMIFAEFNPDCMARDALLEFWRSTNLAQPLTEARKFFGDPPYHTDYVRVFKNLGEYANNKATAMYLRANGQIRGAQEYEQACETIYQELPAWAKW